MRWLIHLVCLLQVLLSSLSQFQLGCVHNFMKILHVTEVSDGQDKTYLFELKQREEALVLFLRAIRDEAAFPQG